MSAFLEKKSLLAKLRKENALPFIDFAFSDFLLKTYSASLELEPLLLHLSQAVRAGHLCIKVTEKDVFPKPENIWEIQENISLSTSEWQELETLIRLGAKIESKALIHSLQDGETFTAPLCRFGSLFYLQKYWMYESICLEKFAHLSQAKPNLQLNSSVIQTSIQQLLSENNLLPEQAQAIAQLDKQSLTLISGGPGTGKTYTAGLLVKVFWNSLSKEQKGKCRIALAAPTGKAAANLQQSLAKAVADLKDFCPIAATTLHTLLGLKSGEHTQISLISADLLIIDECSMIDIRLMSLLLQALKSGSRVIMLGDPFQLPPIGAGSFFADRVSMGQPPQVIELKKCLRSELADIIDLAKEVKSGASQAALHLLNSESLSFHPLPKDQTPTNLQQMLWEKAWPYLAKGSELSSIDPIQQFRILSPLRQGTLGVDKLNAFFYKEFVKKSRNQERLAIPILIVNNDAKKGLFNGDVGLLFKHQPFDAEGRVQAEDYAIISGKKLPALLLPRYEYAFCLSVHKSQGSEFDHVLLLLPDGSEHFGREMVYTGITRARKCLEIWSTPAIWEETIKQKSDRLSRIHQ
jgi:exodeoxyribonuclease V alpha subunit